MFNHNQFLNIQLQTKLNKFMLRCEKFDNCKFSSILPWFLVFLPPIPFQQLQAQKKSCRHRNCKYIVAVA